ncbi:MAG: sigma-70 family RNA polymerase sigma factor [Planctomycetales bacterium]|nr:sigma-70 family RNA polymerase sigma factor [Planctomycetales bacterium]
MTPSPETRPSLLVRIQDADDVAAWSEFSQLYQPVIYRIARRKGLQDADARDVTQHVMTSVAKSIHRWTPDEDRASFRTWLNRVAQNALIDFVRTRKPDIAKGGTSVWHCLESQPDQLSIEQDEWEWEQRREIFRWAARHIRHEFTATSWSAFQLTTVDGLSPAAAAEQLNMTIGSVYTAKSRIMRRLKEQVQHYE